MKVLGMEKFSAAIFEPFSAGKGLAFWAMPIRAGNGELSITCLMGSIF
jgi:hypothetical protein